jgi:hypothetical protein
VLGYGGGRYAAELFVPASHGIGYQLALLAALPPLWLFVVGIHEFGHLVGGWLTGGRFLLFIVGPFQWRRTPAGVRFSWNRSLILAGGLASCLPTDNRDLPRRIAGMIVAGPLASAWLALAAWGVFVWATAAGSPVAQHLAAIVALLSSLFCAATALPGEIGGFQSDGRRFLALRRGDARSAQEAALLPLTVAGLGGTRPRDYAPAVVAAAKTHPALDFRKRRRSNSAPWTRPDPTPPPRPRRTCGLGSRPRSSSTSAPCAPTCARRFRRSAMSTM